MKKVAENKIARLVRELLVELGEDPEREGLKKTPQRVARAMAFLTGGYCQNRTKIVNQAIFHTETDQMVVLKDFDLAIVSAGYGLIAEDRKIVPCEVTFNTMKNPEIATDAVIKEFGEPLV